MTTDRAAAAPGAASDSPAGPRPSTPYVGPRPFERADAPVFIGREAEAEELMYRVIANTEVVLYSPSGAGKTSLVNARLIPLLEGEGCEVLTPVRVQQIVPGFPASAVPNVYAFHTLVGWAGGADLARLAGMTLTDYLLEREYRLDEDDRPR